MIDRIGSRAFVRCREQTETVRLHACRCALNTSISLIFFSLISDDFNDYNSIKSRNIDGSMTPLTAKIMNTGQPTGRVQCNAEYGRIFYIALRAGKKNNTQAWSNFSFVNYDWIHYSSCTAHLISRALRVKKYFTQPDCSLHSRVDSKILYEKSGPLFEKKLMPDYERGHKVYVREQWEERKKNWGKKVVCVKNSHIRMSDKTIVRTEKCIVANEKKEK